MKKFRPITKEELNKLPADIVTKVKNTLKAYSECDIEFENGKYHLGVPSIRSHYAPDHKFIGVVYQDDIYTLEERIENYRNEFGCEPYYLLQELKTKENKANA